MWTGSSRTLVGKLIKHGNDKDNKNFYWVAKVAKIIDRLCPNYCPCCKNKCQTIEHWLVECTYFNVLRDEFSSILTVIINQISTTTTASSANIETYFLKIF